MRLHLAQDARQSPTVELGGKFFFFEFFVVIRHRCLRAEAEVKAKAKDKAKNSTSALTSALTFALA